MMRENEFYDILLKEKENAKISVTLEGMEIIPNYKLKDSPDFVLKIRLKLSLLSQTFEIEIPIPIELEKSGIDEALVDLQKFIERERFSLTLPMLIVSDKKIAKREEERKIKTKFKLRQIPYRLIK
ncbi:MAG: hypothetical protein B6U95_04015 [Thermofilum sp. ex4484_82]|nr:MAG: hypothetical protein B6U95_04015 [Thermofilum sp. ex4484_82]OYT38582.1 MAG: hypothetical protein B6U96_04010 [Archaeoglobales archaeon ex4484_92]